MQLPPEHLRRLTLALRDPASARAAAHGLLGVEDDKAIEGLCALLANSPDDATALAALRALDASSHPLARDAICRAARSATSRVRLAALGILRSRRDPEYASVFAHIIASDPAARLRREALRALAELPAEQRWPMLTALSDPVWRVRLDAVRLLLTWQRESPRLFDEIRTRLDDDARRNPVVAGALRYLEFLATPDVEPPPRSTHTDASADQPWRAAAWWDDDPPVLEQNLRHLTEDEVRADLALLPGLLTLQDGRPVWPFLQGICRFVIEALAALGEPEHLASALRLLDEPRRPQVGEWVRQLLCRLTPERIVAANSLSGRPLEASASPARVRNVRRSFAASEPQPERLLAVEPAASLPHPRSLGRTGLTVAPLGISGRFELPERGFRVAIEAGVNCFFWEPGYRSQTRCWQRLPTSLKERLVVVAGSFAADARSVRRDLQHALQSLGVSRLAVFLLFWVRSQARLAEETLEALVEIREAGLVQAVGLSTHLRPLAVQAVRDGWDVVMVRHSLAHRGAEGELFPMAAQEGTGVIVFSSLCSGRLPKAPDSHAAQRPRPTPAECYRYSLSHPGVSACLSAPRDLDQLRHNLQVLTDPTLDAEAMAALRPWGDAVYRHHRAFAAWLRGHG
jgi:diketogulonate reductase-like aldo/keto reductase